MTRAEYKAAWGRSPRGQFSWQRKSAARRGIDWQLTFAEWLGAWGDKLPLRGRRKGQYVMARPGDIGPYAKDNVSIITVEDNIQARKSAAGSKHGMAKLTEGCVERVRDMLRMGVTQREVAALFGVGRTTITAINSGANWHAA